MAADDVQSDADAEDVRCRSRPASIGAIRRRLALWPLLILVMAAACTRPPRSLDIVRVGVAAPLTGARAGDGRDVVDAVRLAVEQWNQGAGAGGLHIELVSYDERDPLSTRRLRADPRMDVVVGYLGEDAAAPAFRDYADGSAPAAVLLSAPAPAPAPPLRGPGVVVLAPDTEQVAGIAAAAVAFQFGPTTVAVAAGDTPPDQAARAAFERAAAGRQLQIVAGVALPALEADESAAVQTIWLARPEVVYMIGSGADAGALWTALRQRESRTNLVLAPGTYGEGFIRGAPGFEAGALVLNLTVAPGETPAGTAFATAFEDRYGRPPSALAGRAYDAARLGLRAIGDAAGGSHPSRAAVRAALAAQTSLDGVLGAYTLAGGRPRTWRLAVERLDERGLPTLLGQPELP